MPTTLALWFSWAAAWMLSPVTATDANLLAYPSSSELLLDMVSLGMNASITSAAARLQQPC